MRVGILTFHCARNYGAVLQAYALQTYLEKQGHQVYVIDYRPSYLVEPYRLFKFGEWRDKGFLAGLKWNLRELLVAPIRGLRNYRFERFVRRRLHLLRIDFDKSCTDIDAFVFGSDQIWNPNICGGYDNHYLADSVAFRGKKCIAYSASVGRVANIEDGNRQLLVRLAYFDKIGVRENSLLKWLKVKGIDNAVMTLDPVMLVGADGFESIIQKPKTRKPFLLLFMLSRWQQAVEIAKTVAARKNLEILEFTSNLETFAFKGKVQTKSPGTFLGLIKEASYIVTTSFHATAFSIMFKKDFTSVTSYDSPNERVQSLLSLFDLESRLCFNEDNIDFSPIDYERDFDKFESVKRESEIVLNSLA
ncbi:MAG: polysaccharide pyruvyl transferase family protein [Candidatus Cryptobacteroides sp.]